MLFYYLAPLQYGLRVHIIKQLNLIAPLIVEFKTSSELDQ